MPCFTIGHSTRTIEEFLEVLHDAKIALIVDVRKLPGSRRHPQFNADALKDSLAGVGIAYRHDDHLAGRRPVSRTTPFEVNAYWQNRSFHNYADFALSEEFAAALDRLQADAADQNVAVMCSEAVWWRCHRRLIADHLIARGEPVIHLMDARKHSPAKLTEGAVVGEHGVVRYPK